MARAWQQAVNGSAQCGTIGLQGNVANAIAALFIACGQDAACVVEASTALTRIESTARRRCVCLGDVAESHRRHGRRRHVSAHRAGVPRRCSAASGTGKASKLAEICAVVALAGELAIVGAMAGGTFAQAHAAGGRKGRRRTAAERPA